MRHETPTIIMSKLLQSTWAPHLLRADNFHFSAGGSQNLLSQSLGNLPSEHWHTERYL